MSDTHAVHLLHLAPRAGPFSCRAHCSQLVRMCNHTALLRQQGYRPRSIAHAESERVYLVARRAGNACAQGSDGLRDSRLHLHMWI